MYFSVFYKFLITNRREIMMIRVDTFEEEKYYNSCKTITRKTMRFGSLFFVSNFRKNRCTITKFLLLYIAKIYLSKDISLTMVRFSG